MTAAPGENAGRIFLVPELFAQDAFVETVAGIE
jgi:hypothetical protein